MSNSAITEKPILFNADMVRAILDGRKTQTRRILGGKRVWPSDIIQDTDFIDGKEVPLGFEHFEHGWLKTESMCPHGQPGDRLWVRETWWQAGDWVTAYPEDDEGHWGGSKRIHFAADGTPPNEPNYDHPNGLQNGSFAAAHPHRVWRKRPSIHMPRWASRITLEITNVRVERIQDISEEDAIAEGIRNSTLQIPLTKAVMYHHEPWPTPVCGESARDAYGALWESINGKDSWDKNPWVWVIEFRRVEQAMVAA
ncbi:hypothetical protein [Microbulbifer sp. THAF38]|uniref:hypothetical protein n=1 Tax=Microbulbifer sp. THAF38 TaxID=2587856 RepID=UPI0012AAB67A|nr:hypothetical protein [Microbulbifer sp. THAF38]QFT55616.1 hypothetical protein FIU95_13760 [Microbulbifer sp. THAF38]